jgi:hypothetical protein
MARTKQQKELMVLIGLLLVAGLVWYAFYGKARTRAAALFDTGPYTPIQVDDYGKPLKDLVVTRGTEYKSSGRNIFTAAPAPPPAAVIQASAAHVDTFKNQGAMPEPPAPPPTLDMKFFGMGSLPSNGPKRAFLQDGDDVHIVGEGDTIKNHIRITHIGNDRIEYEDTLTGAKNSTNLEMPPPA